MSVTGIVEGFFGPAWSLEARLQYASFLGRFPNSFYFYAPKRDPFLRKKWREDWSRAYLNQLKSLILEFQKHGVEFGVGLSPFELGDKLSTSDKELLKMKVGLLSDLGIDRLGLFFDDMPVSDHLADVQAEVVQAILPQFSKGLMFCPSYYSDDPILDKVFGQRPLGYLEKISELIPTEVSLLWTGPKVISDEITHSHLIEVTRLLKRKPFIWENLYANDGPKNCKFLKLKYFTGRGDDFLADIEGMALNLMNQPYLSQILFLSSTLVLKDKLSPSKAFQQALTQLVDPSLKDFILSNREFFLSSGLDKIDIAKKSEFIIELQKLSGPVAEEIKDWINGKYLVGPECLTD